jgi:hypothetical protein
MTTSPYELRHSEDKLLFEFESVGKVHVSKLIEYTPLLEHPNIYNLGFGDKLPDGKIDDKIVTDNGDMEKVFATVINSMEEFFKHRPDKVIFFQGSDHVRQRLYRGILSKFLDEILKNYDLYGSQGQDVVAFEKGKVYDGYFVKRKSV